jgi:hypothetical protein
LLVVSLIVIVVVVLISSLLVYTSLGEVVSNEVELRDAVNNAERSCVIKLDNDITLTETLDIPANTKITLTSNSITKFYKLIGVNSISTIWIESGALILDGIIVTHEKDSTGNGVGHGVYVVNSGYLIMLNGEISGNTGSGVENWGTFEMQGGKISNNNVNTGYYGGGVNLRSGSFVMSGGEISGNTATNGGGVHVSYSGSLVSFSMTGGKITNNRASSGGGVYVSSVGTVSRGVFKMSGGEISNNHADDTGGGIYNSGDFVMSGGTVSNNEAMHGGGIFNYDGSFTANSYGDFTMTGGKIVNNVASENGGGIGVFSSADNVGLKRIHISDKAVFSNNRASTAYSRDTADDELYNSHIGSRATWTSPFTQGYNNYDIEYTKGTSINDYDGTNSDNRYVAIVVLAVVLIIIAVLVFYFKKRNL